MLLWVSFRSCWRPCWPWYHHGLPVHIPGAGQKHTASHGCVFPHLGLSHSTVSLITPMCACAHKHKLNLTSLTRCFARMEHDFHYLVSDCHQPHTSLLQALDGSWRSTVGSPSLLFSCSQMSANLVQEDALMLHAHKWEMVPVYVYHNKVQTTTLILFTVKFNKYHSLCPPQCNIYRSQFQCIYYMINFQLKYKLESHYMAFICICFIFMVFFKRYESVHVCW